MSYDDAIREIESATSDLQVFAVLIEVFRNSHIKLILAALAKVEELAMRERRK